MFQRKSEYLEINKISGFLEEVRRSVHHRGRNRISYYAPT